MELGWKIRASPAANKSLVPLPRDDARLDPLLGATIRKIFGSQWYYGQVIAIDTDVTSGERAYHVAYEDGDEEHLSALEVKRFLAAPTRSARPSEAGRSARPSTAGREPGTPRPSLPPASARPSRGGHVRIAPKPTWARSLGEVKLASLGTILGTMGIGIAIVISVSTCLSCLSSLLSSGDTETTVSDLRSASFSTALPPWAQAAPDEEVPLVTGSRWSPPPMEEVELPSSKEPTPLHVERELPESIVTAEIEVAEVPEAEDVSSTFETNLPHDFSSVEHMEPVAGGAAESEAVAVQTVADEELAAAAAALVEASGLVVRVAGRAFVRTLEEAWHYLLGGMSATLCGAAGGSGPEPSKPEPQLEANSDEAVSGLESLMTSVLVACAGVITILVSIRPAEDVPTALPHFPRPEAQTGWPGQASPMRPYVGKPSPAHFPSPNAVPAPALFRQATQQELHACNTPARAKTTLQQVKVEIPSTPPAARPSLMSRLGRTPATVTAAVPPGPVHVERRSAPPPPVSLTATSAAPVEPSPAPQQAPLREHIRSDRTSQAKEGACARCGKPMYADANFCKNCGQQRGKKLPQVPHGQAFSAGQRAKSKQADKPRGFRYAKQLSKLKELGHSDCEEIRDILTKCSGDLNAALRELNPGSRA
ncbi:unnamed protein product [Symbiodinium pilosum]|uniref:PTM/DIR17-like Tudor domain-containing protein n=1 Tax=Symbiodinium pilosum TaxID=2952 RepID=A0A812XRI4_SYMPI|nr:unnamed protein product [Symbiodinium pilosum]